MATIGQPLVQPEDGWKRLDDTDSAIKYEGVWVTESHASYFQGSSRYSEFKNKNCKLTFKFKGTKIRILAPTYTNKPTDIPITIDGVTEIFSEYSSTLIRNQVLVYEKLGLTDTIHTVTISTPSSVATITNGDIQIDAIDIDSTGRLFHPDEVTDIKDLEVGKRIRCHYQATANTYGVFSNLGQETSDFIPVTSSNVPNGDFYFIFVDDENKKKRLIADRNIQHSISWDTLNGTGVASGSGLPINLYLSGRYFSIIRLLTGGVNNTDKDNEWDKYILGSTLNGSVVAGDNNIWNHSSVFSWTSTTSSAGNLRTIRTTTWNAGSPGSHYIGVNVGFRPVLIIEDILKTHTFIKSNNQYKTFKNNQWNNVSTTLPSESVFVSDGMQNLSVLDRKETKFKQDMSDNGELGEGKIFKSTIDLKKLFEIRKIEIE